jgi:uncharacterized protein (TIRG00374 family)
MRKKIFTLFKIIFSFLFIFFLIKNIDSNKIIAQLSSLKLNFTFFSLTLIYIQLLLISIRWHLITELIKARVSFKNSVSISLIGQFFNQILPSSIGGDAVKIWMVKNQGIRLGRATSGVICDRLSGLFINILLPSISFYLFPCNLGAQFQKIMESLNLFSSFTFFSLLFLIFLGPFLLGALQKNIHTMRLGNLIQDIRLVLLGNKKGLFILMLSILNQIVGVAIIFTIAKGLSVQLDFNIALVLVPTIMLVSFLPISFAGWGIREGAMLYGLAFAGIADASAISISIIFGILQILSGIPGMFLWITYKRKY